jgi:hypothetical protein
MPMGRSIFQPSFWIAIIHCGHLNHGYLDATEGWIFMLGEGIEKNELG